MHLPDAGDARTDESHHPRRFRHWLSAAGVPQDRRGVRRRLPQRGLPQPHLGVQLRTGLALHVLQSRLGAAGAFAQVGQRERARGIRLHARQ